MQCYNQKKAVLVSSQNVYSFLLELAEFVGNSIHKVHVLTLKRLGGWGSVESVQHSFEGLPFCLG